MVSIIIQTYNEVDQIAATIGRTQAAHAQADLEIIVADGGSTDDTIKIAGACGARVIISERKGRAAQMNKGAHSATGEILYFLHADSIPPQGFTCLILEALGKGA